jgi:hypothetical protein
VTIKRKVCLQSGVERIWGGWGIWGFSLFLRDAISADVNSLDSIVA